MENPHLDEVVQKANPMKEWLVDYVGNKLKPANNEVTVAMLVEAMADEFPEFVMVVAEENFIRGYQQAFTDLEAKGEITPTLEQQKNE
jgi:hypothetical protein